ncbi:MAG TPA: hypothetical protein VL096_15765, partial [Pirellulaceae bacterium]|nr:hypothetical protein [Pirellulaceae bacterium]
WLVDNTSRSATLRGQVSNAVRGFYSGPSSTPGEAPDRLLSVVVDYGDQPPTTLPEPTSIAAEVSLAFDKLGQGSGDSAATFATLSSVIDKYAPYRTQQKREVMFVLVTAQRGSDWEQAEAPIAALKKLIIPVYVIGWPAPLGKAELDNKAQTDLGPESRYKEAIELESLTGGYDLEFMDSGFGPFPLEWLARATDGRFVALRPTYEQSGFGGPLAMSWPNSQALQFDARVMKKYAPDYVSEAKYQEILQGNAACRALHQAAKLPRAEARTQLRTQFAKRSEAQFATELGRAQQDVARLEPAVEALYDALAAGEGDRAKLTSARWQVEYDIAMGRACAVKARLDGYNAMLAMLKNGKSFEKATSTSWRIQPSATTQAGSALTKLVERSQLYLKRVADEHPGTPWAALAQRELETLVGWEWVEE